MKRRHRTARRQELNQWLRQGAPGRRQFIARSVFPHAGTRWRTGIQRHLPAVRKRRVVAGGHRRGRHAVRRRWVVLRRQRHADRWHAVAAAGSRHTARKRHDADRRHDVREWRLYPPGIRLRRILGLAHAVAHHPSTATEARPLPEPFQSVSDIPQGPAFSASRRASRLTALQELQSSRSAEHFQLCSISAFAFDRFKKLFAAQHSLRQPQDEFLFGQGQKQFFARLSEAIAVKFFGILKEHLQLVL